MSTPFTASTGGDSKRQEVAKIPTGMRLCTLHSVVGVGTQEGGEYGPKNTIYLGFEFPQELRVFWEGDAAKPCNIWQRLTLSMHEKSGLRKKFVEPMIEKTLTEEEAKDFDLASLLGRHFIATITHSADGKYANIASITPLTEQGKSMFGITGVVEQINPTAYFHLGMQFDSDNFKSLKLGASFLREKIITSAEGLAHVAAGGTFPEKDTTATTGNGNAPASSGRRLVMLPTSTHTEDQLISAGWTQQQIVDNGYGKWQEAVAPPVPLPAAAAPTPPVLPPVPSPVAAPPVPAKTEPVFTMKDPTAKESDYIALGWTREQLVEHGHASFQ